MLTTSMPNSARRAACRSNGTSTLRRRIECTRCASGASAPSDSSNAGFDEQSHKRCVALAAAATSTMRFPAAGS